jgi:signal transduction histidine kinase
MPTKVRHTRQLHREQLLDEVLPQFEQFVESREGYIKALETTIQALKIENTQGSEKSLSIRNSIDELVAMQQLSNIVSTAVEPEMIVSMLFELTRRVIPVLDANIFLFDAEGRMLNRLSSKSSEQLQREARAQLEAGIIDWVLSEKKTVIIPDLSNVLGNGSVKNYVIVPLTFRGEGMGIYFIHTDKPQQEFSNQDIQLLTVLANQAAAGVVNWQSYEQMKKIDEELKSSHAQMLHVAKLAAIGEFAASIAHEIKNPLQMLMLHLELWRRGRAMPEMIDLMGKEVQRLAQITKRLVGFSRNVEEEAALEPVNINRVIGDVIAIVEYEFKASRIEFVLALHAQLPVVFGHANYLQQVFLNLLLNARDAMPKGGTIRFTTDVRDSKVTIIISDSGEGIAPENLKKIFQPFFTTKGERGTGLGLSICNKIINQHDGRMTVDSVVGTGTTFTIVLPIRRKS